MPFNWADYTKSNPLPPRTTGPGLPPINQLVDQDGNVFVGDSGPDIPRRAMPQDMTEWIPGIGGMAALAANAPPPPGPAQMTIWNGMGGTGYDANFRQVSPNGMPTFPAVNNSPFRDLAVSNPGGAPLGTFTAGPTNFRDYDLNSQEGNTSLTPQMRTANQTMQATRMNTPFEVGTPQWNAAIQNASNTIYGQGFAPMMQNQLGMTGAANDAARIASENQLRALQGSALYSPGGVREQSVQRTREALIAQGGHTPDDINSTLNNMFGNGTVRGTMANITPPPPGAVPTEALSGIFRRNPTTGRPITTELQEYSAATRPAYFNAITDVVSRLPDGQISPEAVAQIRQRFGEIPFQEWWQENLPIYSPQSGAWFNRMTPQQQLHAQQRFRLGQATGQQQNMSTGIPGFRRQVPITPQNAGGLPSVGQNLISNLLNGIR